jgi:stage II sporulation protein D
MKKFKMKKFWAAAFALFLSAFCARAQDREVRIGVLGLFHPQEVIVAQVSGGPLTCTAGDERWVVNGRVLLVLDGTAIKVTTTGKRIVGTLRCGNGPGGPADFAVTIPQKLSRRYRGTLEVQPRGEELEIAVAMDVETAVASVVAAESPPSAPLEALKAQAVASRSFLIAGRGRHKDFDFCDTTHCQFLRQPPEAGSPAAQATAATRGLVLAYKGESFAAMYSASCGGKTHSLEELGIPVHGYPYFAVDCEYCRRHPERWAARLSQADAESLSHTEASRLKLARKLGWKVVPGNSYLRSTKDGEVTLEGSGVGHGIGLCQRGAADMARHGATVQQILEHYYPNTELKTF